MFHLFLLLCSPPPPPTSLHVCLYRGIVLCCIILCCAYAVGVVFPSTKQLRIMYPINKENLAEECSYIPFTLPGTLLYTGITIQIAEHYKLLVFWLRNEGGGDSSVVRAPDSWLKGRGFESLLERRENFLLQGRLSVLTLISVSVPPPCYRSST